MKLPRINEVIRAYFQGGIEAVKNYYEDSEMEVEIMSWHGMIKGQLEKGLYNTVEIEIKLMETKFNTIKNE